MMTALRPILGTTLAGAAALSALLGVLLAARVDGPHWDAVEGELPGLAPFTAVRWSGDVPEVEVDGAFHELVAIDGVRTDELVEACRDAYGSRWRKRFAEDLLEVLWRFGRPALFEVTLELRDLATGERSVRRGVPMTAAKRRDVYGAAHPEGALAAGTGASASADELSPFTAVRWNEATPEVELDGRWYRPLAMAGVDVSDILDHCRATYGDRWQKRFSEDLVEVLDGLGVRASTRIALVLEDLETGETLEVPEAPMTEANRRSVWELNQRAARAQEAAAVRRVDREHAAHVPEAYRGLSRLLQPDETWNAPALSFEEATADLDQLEQVLLDRYSYLHAKGVDHRAAFDAVRLGLGPAVDARAFAIALMKLLALFGDGHTRLDVSPTGTLPTGYLPFLVGDSKGRAVAFSADREALVSEDFPYLRSIDEVPIDVWLEVAAAINAAGSPQFVRRSAMRTLRYVGYLRRELLLPAHPTVRVELEDESGTRTEELELPLSARKLNHGQWPRSESRRLDGDIGYLRIAAMRDDPEVVADLHAWMRKLEDTSGLVIDVRGNGGGTRHATIELLPYFLGEGEAPRVVNAAYYRLPPGEEERPGGHLANRFLFTPDHPGWSRDVQRLAAAFARDFEPEWDPGDGFEGPHVFIVGGEPPPFRYEAPVVVLTDSDCYSATDVFLGAFAEVDGVTLLGTPSGGGSGRARRVRLLHSGFVVRVSSMASFRPDGRLYDGRGVEPDVLVEPVPADFTRRSDTVLDAALDLLAGS